jgi:hypothetical protein
MKARPFQRIQKYFRAQETTQLLYFLMRHSGTRCQKAGLGTEFSFWTAQVACSAGVTPKIDLEKETDKNFVSYIQMYILMYVHLYIHIHMYIHMYVPT